MYFYNRLVYATILATYEKLTSDNQLEKLSFLEHIQASKSDLNIWKAYESWELGFKTLKQFQVNRVFSIYYKSK